MNFRHVWIVFTKEVKDIARDKKTLITTLLVPIIIMPLLFSLLGGGMKNMEKDITENITVALTKSSDTQEIRDLILNDIFYGYDIKLVDSVDNPTEAIRNGDIRFVLEVEENYSTSLEEKVPFTIKIMYDQSDTKSSGSYGILMEAVSGYNQRVVQRRLEEMNIDLSILEPVRIDDVNVADENKSGNFMLMMMLPMLITILIAVGGIPAATDLAAGEKERGTFEPLLTTQAGRMSILFGKYLTVTLFSIISVIAQSLGMLLGTVVSPGFFTMGGESSVEDLAFHIPPVALVYLVLITIALGMVFAGIQLAVSTYAKSFKEAQTYLSFLIFIAMVPAYATMMMQPGDIKMFMFFVPLFNAIASLKMVLGNAINYTYLGIALVTSIAYVIISLFLAASLFNKEKVLFRS